MSSANAGLRESVPIVGALACGLAGRASVRALLIKGAPATAMGVRSQRPSVDVDLWVDPVRFDDYLETLARAGWRHAPGPPDGVGWGHAVTMVHPGWVSTIDVHRRFPGFLTDDTTGFEIAWQTRSTAWIAHQEVAVPSRVTAAAITVLHAARSTTIAATLEDLSCALATARLFSGDERDELSRLVTATGSAEPLSALVEEAGCEVVSSIPDPERLQEWRVRLGVGVRTGSGWLLALRAASWPRRALLIIAALQPNMKDYALSGAPRTPRGYARASIYRWRRSVRALPTAIRTVREAVTARTR